MRTSCLSGYVDPQLPLVSLYVVDMANAALLIMTAQKQLARLTTDAVSNSYIPGNLSSVRSCTRCIYRVHPDPTGWTAGSGLAEGGQRDYRPGSLTAEPFYVFPSHRFLNG